MRQQTAVSVERFGKFESIRHSGLQMKIPIIDKVAARISLKIQQLDVIVETKTLDDVFVKIKVSVQFVVIKEKVYDAIYKLEYPHDQITSYVFDVVRAEVPKMKLDDVFVKKDDIAIAVKREVQESMETYGYDIIKTLVTDIDPDAQVKAAMNRINAAEREKVAAQYEGDAQRILIVEKAKAEADAIKLKADAEAEAVKKRGEAEAKATEARLAAEAEGKKKSLLAEAEGLNQKAEAMKKYGEGAILEMYFKALPEIAKNVAAPLSNIDRITMYGADGTSNLVSSITQSISKISDGVQDSTGIDFKSVVAGYLGKGLLDKAGNLKTEEIKKLIEQSQATEKKDKENQ